MSTIAELEKRVEDLEAGFEKRIAALERKPTQAVSASYGQSGNMPNVKMGDKTEHGEVVAVTPGIPGVSGPSVVSHG